RPKNVKCQRLIAALLGCGEVICGGSGGEGGIRTHGTVARTPHFECGTIDHSATSPTAYLSKGAGLNKGGRSPPFPWPFLGRLLGPLPALPYWEPAKPAFRTMSPQRTI